MLYRFISLLDVRFKKNNGLKVLFFLVINIIKYKVFSAKKWIHSIDRPIIHLYAVSWNEAKILPFVMEYYLSFVDHFYIYDNYSDDETDELLNKYPQVTVQKYDTGGTFNDVVHQQIKNTVWKQSRAKADWVIVIDMDELIYHPELIAKLSDKNNKATIYKPKGFDMVTTEFPDASKPIIETVQKGVPSFWLDKCILFNPNKIVDINYLPGAHECYPEGIVRFDEYTTKLLHYKYIGFDYVMSRIFSYRKRISQVNIEMDYGMHYFEEDQLIRAKFNKFVSEAAGVI